jgi:hypothetical protein
VTNRSDSEIHKLTFFLASCFDSNTKNLLASLKRSASKDLALVTAVANERAGNYLEAVLDYFL